MLAGINLFMHKNKQQRLKLPRLRSQVSEVIGKSPYDQPQQRFIRYNTESIASYHQNFIVARPSRKNPETHLPNARRRSHQNQSQQERVGPNKKMQIITLLQSNRESASKNINRSSIIDTRKSIKILIDYFQAKIQEAKHVNSNCYHSPKKQPYGVVEAHHASENYRSIRRSILDNRKRCIAWMSQDRSASRKKQKRPNIATAFKIQNALLPNNVLKQQNRSSNKQKRRNVIEGKASVFEVDTGLTRESVNKVTQFGGWKTNDLQDTEYLS